MTAERDEKPILIAGPTASGKSALAVEVARRTGGTVINADSQQIYREWQILTARPTEAEMGGIPHRLFGHVPIDRPYSAGHWLREVEAELERSAASHAPLVIVGGTGLYFRALTSGLAEIPEIPAGIRATAEAELRQLGPEGFAEAFARRDPETAAEIDLANPRRVLRAWEVLDGTGRGLAAWRALTPPPLLPLAACRAVALVPDRDWLYARCEERFDAMLSAGALEEARRVLQLGLPPGTPGLGAVGAAELMAHVRGELPLEQAADLAKTETRRYAKRQLTWIRNQMRGWQSLDPVGRRAVDLAKDICAL